jgi:hypothetical protein
MKANFICEYKFISSIPAGHVKPFTPCVTRCPPHFSSTTQGQPLAKASKVTFPIIYMDNKMLPMEIINYILSYTSNIN